MPRVDAINQVNVARTARLAQVEGMFDMEPVEESRLRWSFNVPIEDRDWQIGMVVGPSGSGKSTVAEQLFYANIIKEFAWPSDKAIVDGFSEEASIKDITAALSNVGFSAPPAWRRPYSALSTGEQFRVTIARALVEAPSPIVIDEFTSVVDRDVAKVASAAIAKSIRKSNKQFVAISCHYDIIDWLQPDWVLQPSTGDFEWRSERRRPEIKLNIKRVDHTVWRFFAHHHYLDHGLSKNAYPRCFVAFWGKTPVAFTSWLPFPVPGQRNNAIREHRTVVLPDFQGVGIGNAVSEEMASHFKQKGHKVYSTTSAPAMVRHRARSRRWKMIRKPSLMQGKQKGLSGWTMKSAKRYSASFQYVGD